MKTKILDFLRLIFKIPFLEKILVKRTINRPFGTFITKLPPNHYQYNRNSTREVKRDNINYKLDISDIVDWYIYFGFQERSRQNLYNLIKRNNTIIDVGANVGDVTLHAAQIVGEKGNIHSFEPDPKNYVRIKTNMGLNTFSNITLNKFGLGDIEGTFKIANVIAGNQGMNRIVSEDSNEFESNKIEVITLDSYLIKTKLNQVDLIKMDVEGFEYNVLKGCKKLIDTFHPTFFIEIDDNNLMLQGSSAKSLITFLLNLGYKVTHAETDQKITSQTNFSNCHFDIIAKHIV